MNRFCGCERITFHGVYSACFLSSKFNTHDTCSKKAFCFHQRHCGIRYFFDLCFKSSCQVDDTFHHRLYLVSAAARKTVSFSETFLCFAANNTDLYSLRHIRRQTVTWVLLRSLATLPLAPLTTRTDEEQLPDPNRTPQARSKFKLQRETTDQCVSPLPAAPHHQYDMVSPFSLTSTTPCRPSARVNPILYLSCICEPNSTHFMYIYTGVHCAQELLT